MHYKKLGYGKKHDSNQFFKTKVKQIHKWKHNIYRLFEYNLFGETPVTYTFYVTTFFFFIRQLNDEKFRPKISFSFFFIKNVLKTMVEILNRLTS